MEEDWNTPDKTETGYEAMIMFSFRKRLTGDSHRKARLDVLVLNAECFEDEKYETDYLDTRNLEDAREEPGAPLQPALSEIRARLSLEDLKKLHLPCHIEDLLKTTLKESEAAFMDRLEKVDPDCPKKLYQPKFTLLIGPTQPLFNVKPTGKSCNLNLLEIMVALNNGNCVTDSQNQVSQYTLDQEALESVFGCRMDRALREARESVKAMFGRSVTEKAGGTGRTR